MFDTKKKKVVAVVGPTGTGKSALAIEIAKRYGGEVVSCDSMQVYRGMDIGTAKVTPEQMQGVPHHLLDVIDPSEPFSCVDYAALANQTIEQLHKKGALPVFCGGTGQYLDAVLKGTRFSDADVDLSLRETLLAKEPMQLWHELDSIDPEAAQKIHPNNKKRVVRALEIYKTTGILKSEWDRRSTSGEAPYDALILGLCCSDRDVLCRRIDKRVDDMIAAGLVEEVQQLSFSENATAKAAIGYKEMIAYLQHKVTLDEAVQNIKTATRQYAKRQMTWFRANASVKWLDISAMDDAARQQAAFSLVEEHLQA
ncbi:MAG: tRNA (adenosine(37)-N6)-dimethylallyltransferase MiaA [Clostridiales bacterium]|nr:tRNA (adenosine(37)-N6)-dimethylallyltransferase MiaA [Clostridiales bacterium]